MKEISRKRIKSGDIIEIEIENYGYCYYKFIIVKDLFKKCSYPAIIRPYIGIYDKPIIDLKNLNRELLYAPSIISGINGILKNNYSKIVANEEINTIELVLPDVKRGYPIFTEGYDINKFNEFKVLKQQGNSDEYFFTTDKNKISHLEWAGAENVNKIPFRMLLENLKLNGKDIKNENITFDWLDELIYQASINLPIYSKLDKATRDFANK